MPLTVHTRTVTLPMVHITISRRKFILRMKYHLIIIHIHIHITCILMDHFMDIIAQKKFVMKVGLLVDVRTKNQAMQLMDILLLITDMDIILIMIGTIIRITIPLYLSRLIQMSELVTSLSQG